MSNSKKKLLILIEWFAPGFKAGGPIQSCINMCKALQPHYDVFVLTTDTDHMEAKPYPGILTNQWIQFNNEGVKVWYATKTIFTRKKMVEIIDALQPEFIYLNLLFSPLFVVYPLWLKLTGHLNCKLILCPRGSLYDSAVQLKAYKKKPLLLLYKWLNINKKIHFHATNNREALSIERYFPGSTITVADNLPDFAQPAFTSRPKEVGIVRCIFIARIVPIKNLLFLLQVMQQVKSGVELTIIGPIENTNYWHNCKQTIQHLPFNISVKYGGAKQPNELMNLVKQHHLFILPTTGENFGHAILEALLAGRPVLISDQTPWRHLHENQAGWDLPLSAPKQFTAIIEHLASANQIQFDRYANGAWQYAHHFLENSVAKQQYIKMFT